MWTCAEYAIKAPDSRARNTSEVVRDNKENLFKVSARHHGLSRYALRGREPYDTSLKRQPRQCVAKVRISSCKIRSI